MGQLAKDHLAFESTHHILSYDQRGHGRSFRPDSGYGPEDYAQDLLMILNELGWQSIQLVGHSMGGRNSIAFASAHPERVEKLVVEDIGPEENPAGVGKIEAMLGKVPTPFTDKRVAKETILAAFAHNPVLGQYLYSNIAEVGPSLYDWRFSKAAVLESVNLGRARQRWEDWKKVQVPTLLIRGETSDELSQSVYEKMLQENQNAQGVVIPKAGHWVHSDQPDAFIQALHKFLN